MFFLSFLTEGRYWALPSNHLLIRSISETDAYIHVSCSAVHRFDPTPRVSNVARVIITGQFFS